MKIATYRLSKPKPISNIILSPSQGQQTSTYLESRNNLHTDFWPIWPDFNVEEMLQYLNLSDDLGFIIVKGPEVAFYVKHGAKEWPCEWTPDGGNFVPFELDDFKIKVNEFSDK